MYQRLAQFNNFFGTLSEAPVAKDPVETDPDYDMEDKGDDNETSQD